MASERSISIGLGSLLGRGRQTTVLGVPSGVRLSDVFASYSIGTPCFLRALKWCKLLLNYGYGLSSCFVVYLATLIMFSCVFLVLYSVFALVKEVHQHDRATTTTPAPR